MAEPESSQGKLYTLSEISKKSGISMPTLQRYKKLYQGRIPAEGKGRKQRYPENALPVFDQIRNENLGKRGRPRKDPSAPRPTASKRRGRPPAAAKAPAGGGAVKRRGRPPGSGSAAAASTSGRRGGRRAGGREGLLTLTQISETTGISYPTLVRYVRLHSDRLPHEGTGRARRFYPQAVDAFRQLRQESGRGGRRKGSGRATAVAAGGRGRGRAASAVSAPRGTDAGVGQRLKAIEKAHQDLEKKFRGLVKGLQNLFK